MTVVNICTTSLAPDIEKALQLVDVVIQYRHQTAGALILKVGHFQMLNVVIGVNAQIMLQGLRQVAASKSAEYSQIRIPASR